MRYGNLGLDHTDDVPTRKHIKGSGQQEDTRRMEELLEYGLRPVGYCYKYNEHRGRLQMEKYCPRLFLIVVAKSKWHEKNV
jgi:hypothetical protein